MLTTFLLLQTGMTVLASSSQDTRLLQDAVCHDEAWIRKQEGEPAKVYWPRAGWEALLGDVDGDGFFDHLPGVDALIFWPDSVPGITPRDFLFSPSFQKHGWLDGDLLRFGPRGGVEVFVAEETLEDLLLPTSGGLDVDAGTMVGDELWLSFRDTLAGTVLGEIKDGDIIAWEIGTQFVRRVCTEAEVQAWVETATGSTAAIGDLTAMSWNSNDMELLFCVQSPSSRDGSVFGNLQGGRLIAGWQEADWSFQVSTELDALALVPDGVPQPPILHTPVPYLQLGEEILHRVRFGTPNGFARGMVSLSSDMRTSPFGGLGLEFLDPTDALYQQQWLSSTFHKTAFDSSGSLEYRWKMKKLPQGVQECDLWVQILDETQLGLSNPVRLKVSR